MITEQDDLEAVRQIAIALEPFKSMDRERILRWVREKLGMLAPSNDTSAVRPVSASIQGPSGNGGAKTGSTLYPSTDIRSFMRTKNPTSGNHFAATVAYYYRFVAPPQERKDVIGKDDLVEVSRLADLKRPKAVAQSLVNAAGAGLLDRAGRGQYRISTVGQNLVGSQLPSTEDRRRAGGGGRRAKPGGLASKRGRGRNKRAQRSS
jgi:hypothetical protein